MEFDDENNNNNNNNNNPVGGDNQSVASAGVRDRVTALEAGQNRLATSVNRIEEMMQMLLQRQGLNPPTPQDPAPFPPPFIGPLEDPAAIQAREARRGAALEPPQLEEEAKVDPPVEPPGVAQLREQQRLAAERLEAHMAAQQRLAAEQRQEQADILRHLEDQRIEDCLPHQQLLAQGVQGRVPPAPDPDNPANDYGQSQGRDRNNINSQEPAEKQHPTVAEHLSVPVLATAPDYAVKQPVINASTTLVVGGPKVVLVYILSIAGHLSVDFYHASSALLRHPEFAPFGCVSPLQTPQVRPLPWPPPSS